jgi:hypothetical protein
LEIFPTRSVFPYCVLNGYEFQKGLKERQEPEEEKEEEEEGEGATRCI